MDVRRETGDAVIGGGKEEVRSRDHVVDDLEHRGAFIASASLPRKHRQTRWRSTCRGQVPGGLAQGAAGHAVGQDTDLQTGAIDAEGAARIQGLMGKVTFGSHTALPGDRCSWSRRGPQSPEHAAYLGGSGCKSRRQMQIPRDSALRSHVSPTVA